MSDPAQDVIKQYYRPYTNLQEVLLLFAEIAVKAVTAASGLIFLIESEFTKDVRVRARADYSVSPQPSCYQSSTEKLAVTFDKLMARLVRNSSAPSPIVLSDPEISLLAVPIFRKNCLKGYIFVGSSYPDTCLANSAEALQSVSTELWYQIARYELREFMKKARGRETDFVVGISSALRRVEEMVVKASESFYPVLLLGETGTGKELAANAISFGAAHRGNPFITVNCSAFTEELAVSELFGHVKGAFTGAISDRKGKFEQAHGGTIFLDEVESLSDKLQTMLLRTLETGEIHKLGESAPGKRVNVRLIAATSRDIERLVLQGRFRRDLYYRMNLLKIEIPPLRQRKEDIKYLVEYFLAQFGSEELEQRVSNEGKHLLEEYDWFGNVRELKNILLRLIANVESEVIDLDHIHQHVPELHMLLRQFKDEKKYSPRSLSERLPLPQALRVISERYERDEILKALNSNNWSITRSATALGVSQPDLSRRIKKLGISRKDNP